MFGVDPIDASVSQALHGLGMQLQAGVRLDKALRAATDINRTLTGRRAFQRARERAMAGEPFEKVLEAMSPVLSYPERAVLAAGWDGGKIDFTLGQVVKKREVMYATRREIRGRLVLPGLILLAASFIAPLPPLLLGRMSLEAYLAAALAAPGVAVAIYFLVRFTQQAQARRWAGRSADAPPPPTSLVDRIVLMLPVLGRVQRQRNLSELALLMGNMLAAGLRILDAMQTTARALPNGVYRGALMRARAKVGAGETLAVALSPIVPRDWTDAIAVAEASGMEERVFERLGAAAREAYIDSVRRWGVWLPRLVYIAVALYVATLILGALGGVRQFYML